MNKYLLIKIAGIFITTNMCIGLPDAIAGTYQSHNSIYQAARNFVRSQVVSQNNQQAEIKIGKLDSRLKLNQCNKKLNTFLPKGSRKLGKTTVGVKCTGRKPWSLHVSVTISVFKDVLVASHQLNKNSILTEADFKLEKHDLAELHYGFFEDLKIAAGMKLKRRVLVGAVLTPAMLKKPKIISRGQQITIMAQSGRMQVRMEGKALANGAVGERIKVMNLKSKQKLEGVVTSTGVVKVEI